MVGVDPIRKLLVVKDYGIRHPQLQLGVLREVTLAIFWLPGEKFVEIDEGLEIRKLEQ